jgi:Glyoxalase-like domain
MPTRLDHLVIGAADLAAGVAYVKTCLGVDMPYGGVHVKMGTHNHVMRLGDDVFLEVLAIDPGIEPPARPRWYGLDDPFVRQCIAAQPALLTWVVRTTRMAGLLQQAGFAFGRATAMSRGDLHWFFGLPEDGGLLAGGMLPYVIEWQTDSHPCAKMADAGCRLQGLEIHHSQPSWIKSILQSIDAADLAAIQALPVNRSPYLVAHIQTPAGPRQLRSDLGPPPSPVPPADWAAGQGR